MENYSFENYIPPFSVQPEEDGNSSAIIDDEGFILCNVWNTHSGEDSEMHENKLIAERIAVFLNAPKQTKTTKSDQFTERLNELQGEIITDLLGYFVISKYGFYKFKRRIPGNGSALILGIEIESEPNGSVFYARVLTELDQYASVRLDELPVSTLIAMVVECENKRVEL